MKKGLEGEVSWSQNALRQFQPQDGSIFAFTAASRTAQGLINQQRIQVCRERRISRENFNSEGIIQLVKQSFSFCLVIFLMLAAMLPGKALPNRDQSITTIAPGDARRPKNQTKLAKDL